jgi:hypothetical protein
MALAEAVLQRPRAPSWRTSTNTGFRRGRFVRRPWPAGAVYGAGMLVEVFGDSHAHAEALEAVIGATDGCGVEELGSLGDMGGGGPDPERVVRRTSQHCTVTLVGNHDYGAAGAVDLARLGEARSPGLRSLEAGARRHVRAVQQLADVVEGLAPRI